MKSLSPVRQKVFEKSVILPPMHQNFLYQIFIEMQKGSPTSFLGVMRHKEFFDRNVMLQPHLPPPSFAWQFSTPEVFWNADVFPYETYRYCEKKVQRWMVKSSSDARISPYPKFSEIQNGYTTKFIGTMRHKKNWKNPWCSPALLCEKIFDTRFFLESGKGSHTIFYGTMRRKTLDGKSWYPHIMHDFFRYPKVSETRKCSPMCSLTTVRQKILTKPWCPLPPIHDSFLIQFFLKYRCLHLRFFSALWDYLFSLENWDTLTPAPSSSLNFFITRNFLKNRRVLLWKFPVMRNKNFDKPVIHPTPMHDKLLYQNSFEIQMCSPTNFIGTVKKFKGEKWYPLLMHEFFYTGKVLK